MKTKKIVSVLLCVLILLIMPLTAFAAEKVENVNTLIVGGTEITSKGYYTQDAEGTWVNWTAQQKPSDNYIYFDGRFTLTLCNVNISGTPSISYGAGIYVDGTRLTIVVKGISKVLGGIDEYSCSSGIYSTGELLFSVTSTGTLNVNGSQITDPLGTSYGIYTSGDITVAAGTLNATGGIVTDEQGTSFGVYVADGGVIMNGGTFNAIGGISFGTMGASFGLFSYDDVTVSGGTLTAEGGAVSGDGSASFGLFSYNDIVVNGGLLDAAGGDSLYGSFGAAANNDIIINGGKLVASGGTVINSIGTSYDVRADHNVMVNGGVLDASGGDSESSSFGIHALNVMVGSDEGNPLLIVNGQNNGIEGNFEIKDNCLVLQNGSGKVSGDFILSEDFLLPEESMLMIPQNASLTIPAGVSLIEEGTVVNKGELFVFGDLVHTGLQVIDDATYYIYADGSMATDSWVESDGKFYYFNKDGSMAAGEWIEYMGNWYYVYSTGIMAVNIKIDGYMINADGIAVR